MSALAELKPHLRPGQVYRRQDLARWSRAVGRHVKALMEDGPLEKVMRVFTWRLAAPGSVRLPHRPTNWSRPS